MNKLSKGSRKLLVNEMNTAMAYCPLPEARQQLINSFTLLLIKCNSYFGFSYNAWNKGGYGKWIADGKPQDNTSYLGDKTQITFY